MDQGQALQIAPTDVELERAIASVPGVVSAGIDRSAATGRSRMRLRLAPGEDEEAVAWAVAATLRERFGIALDPDAIRPRVAAVPDGVENSVHVMQAPDQADTLAARDSAGSAVAESAEDLHGQLLAELSETRERLRAAAACARERAADLADATDLAELPDLVGVADPAGIVTEAGVSALDPSGAATDADGDQQAGSDTDPVARDRESRTVIPRAAIRDLRVRRDARDVQVSVVLEHAGRREEGRASSVPTSQGILRAVAEATVAALRGLTVDSLLVGIDRVSVKLGDDAPMATVVISLLTRRGEERLLGVSMVRDGVERAVMRATLDALNRRVTPLLVASDAEFVVPR